jgi:hypothetical protein
MDEYGQPLWLPYAQDMLRTWGNGISKGQPQGATTNSYSYHNPHPISMCNCHTTKNYLQ